MGQVSYEARMENFGIGADGYSLVHIPKTNKYVKISGIKPGTIEKLTELWLERDVQKISEDAPSTLKSLCKEPFFAVKEACIFTINSYWGLRFIYPIKWRIWAFFRGYTEEQMTPIIAEGKKKLPLMAHWKNMALSADMRTDWKKMTGKEAEQYRAELLLVAKQPL